MSQAAVTGRAARPDLKKRARPEFSSRDENEVAPLASREQLIQRWRAYQDEGLAISERMYREKRWIEGTAKKLSVGWDGERTAIRIKDETGTVVPDPGDRRSCV